MRGRTKFRTGARSFMQLVNFDVIIIGAGGAGLMCAIEAGKRGRRVLLLDHAHAVGEKIRISGGGRCNFTNLNTTPENFLSENPRFCISALAGYTQHDFIALVRKHGIAFHEKTLGQLFCDGSSRQIIDMLLAECREAGVIVQVDTKIERCANAGDGFVLDTNRGSYGGTSLVIATGGKSIPKMGATGFGYDVARQFGLEIVTPRPALVPFTFGEDMRRRFQGLSGIAVDAVVRCGRASFAEALLFTHRGLSGPAILQISSYWREGAEIAVNLAPGTDVFDYLREARKDHPKQSLPAALALLLPKRLAEHILDGLDNAFGEGLGSDGRLADLPDRLIKEVASAVNDWHVVPSGTEGFRTAEVTAGGVDTRGLSSKTFEARRVPGLYFIGEVLDVTGYLGGYNFQWAWSSGYAAGQYV
jgi:predicted Rossmann fold flavoprotein